MPVKRMSKKVSKKSSKHVRKTSKKSSRKSIKGGAKRKTVGHKRSSKHSSRRLKRSSKETRKTMKGAGVDSIRFYDSGTGAEVHLKKEHATYAKSLDADKSMPGIKEVATLSILFYLNDTSVDVDKDLLDKIKKFVDSYYYLTRDIYYYSPRDNKFIKK
jgi:hypothetical protein